eukprot:3359432-Amphidinium_carterae.1
MGWRTSRGGCPRIIAHIARQVCHTVSTYMYSSRLEEPHGHNIPICPLHTSVKLEAVEEGFKTVKWAVKEWPLGPSYLDRRADCGALTSLVRISAFRVLRFIERVKRLVDWIDYTAEEMRSTGNTAHSVAETQNDYYHEK